MIRPYLTALAAVVVTIPASGDLVIGPLPPDAPAGFSGIFTKHVDVLGLHVYATFNTPDNKVLHCANILAQWIDNNEDGEVDEPDVHATMLANGASMLMWRRESDAEDDFDDIPDETWDNYILQPLFGQETNPGFPGNGWFDATLEETLHLVTWGGYAPTYPKVFGESHGSQIANAMDDCITGGWYHYDDPTCHYDCLVTEYTYWVITSILGAQDYPWRIEEIEEEWELWNSSLVQTHDAAAFAIVTDPVWKLPTVLPDGSYTPTAPCIADLDGNGYVAVGDLLIVLDGWGQTGHAGDINGSGNVNVNDLLIVLEAWGDCPE
jgi:hypothetical protein